MLGVERAGLFAGLIPIGALLSAPLVGAGALTLHGALGALLVCSGVVLGLSRLSLPACLGRHERQARADPAA